MSEGTWVNIIESVAQHDILEERSEGELLKAGLKLIGIPFRYSLVRDYGEFMDALGKGTLEGTTEFGRLPALHFSMHGSNAGVVLTSEKQLSWQDLSWKLRLLNGKFQNLLLVCMSSCRGLGGYQMLLEGMVSSELQATAPFALLVGNVNDVPWSDAGIAYLTFYHLRSKGVGFHEAIQGMRIASGNRGFFGTVPDPSKKSNAGLIVGITDEEARSLDM